VTCFELGWVARVRDTRAVKISSQGRRGLAETFGIALPFAARAWPPLDPPHERSGRIAFAPHASDSAVAIKVDSFPSRRHITG
jgi:hypothetical protein